MKQLLLKSILFTIIVLVLLFGVMDRLFLTNTHFNRTMRELNRYEADEVDIFFCGSSHVFTAFNPEIIDKELHLNSMNLGSGAQNLETTAFLINEILEDYNPKLIVLDVFPGNNYHLNAPTAKGFQLEVFDNLENSVKKLKYLRSLYSVREFPSVLSPTIRNHKDWNDRIFGKFDFIKENDVYNRGFWNNNEVRLKDSDKQHYKNFNSTRYSYDTIRRSIPKKVKDIIIKIDSIIKKHNKNLMFVSTPYLDWYKDPNGNYYEFTTAIQRMSDSLDVPYLNFNKQYDSLPLDFSDFKDVAHVNAIGAEKVSQFFAGYIREKDFLLKKRQKDSLWIEEQSENFEYVLKTPKLLDRLPGTKVMYTAWDSLQVKKFYIHSKPSNMSKIILELKSPLQTTGEEYIIQFHGKPIEAQKQFISSEAKSKGRDRNIWYGRPKAIRVKERFFLVFEIPATQITAYETILLYFQDAKTLDVVQPPLIIGSISTL
ncbi:hypothetical protein [Altibacter sp.]|uniref:hypothetical protein n=1 Tax=Altibacter sp. TaxID=2024823 RepID=UPI000C906E2E|nr:hypothetical protein [Altibacter sp.]MAP54380.1 hypothetical protein [Altibacter sp.]|tara:strand:+ start:645 stop:2096 length:1452 start_codon:yes stop_codon:yes gene_type:complete